jgi:hypothetical protein
MVQERVFAQGEVAVDELTKSLLIELARATLRVLAPATSTPAIPSPPPAPAPAPVIAQVQVPAAVAAPPASVQRLDVVRIWSGDRYECGVVQSISRDKASLTVRIDRGEGRRSKLVKAPVARAVLIQQGVH